MSSTSNCGYSKSPISADLIAGGDIGLEQVCIDGEDIYRIEPRGHKGGPKNDFDRLDTAAIQVSL